MKVSVNPPKTPVTKGSKGIACATIPNVCKMPGPPAPFVPVPLPNIGKSGDSPKGYSKKVKIQGKSVAIKGATFKSIGDIASKGTGGGLISANTHGPTKFVGPGSLNTKIEGKNVHLLADPMLNNCGGSGSPPNAATLVGVLQMTNLITLVEKDACPVCDKKHDALEETEITDVDTSTLSSKFEEILDAQKVKATTMLGVAHCKCGKRRFGEQSGVTTIELTAAAKVANLEHREGAMHSYGEFGEVITKDNRWSIMDAEGVKTLADIEARLSHFDGLGKLISKGNQLSEASRDKKRRKTHPVAYPPGACAAQRLLLLVLDAKGVPTGLTEKYFNSSKGKTAPVEFERVKSDGTRETLVQTFRSGDSVPPCGTCSILLPALLCTGEQGECDHD